MKLRAILAASAFLSACSPLATQACPSETPRNDGASLATPAWTGDRGETPAFAEATTSTASVDGTGTLTPASADQDPG